MPEPLVVIGAGGFGRETLDVADAINSSTKWPRWTIRGVVDDAPSEANLSRLSDRGVPWLGTLETLVQLDDEVKIAIGIGTPRPRRSVFGRLELPAARHATLVHPTVVMGSCCQVGAGSVLCAGVVLGTNVTVGEMTHLNAHAVVGHDSVLADFVSVNPNATVSGECHIGEAVLIGAGAVVLQGRTVGKEALVGAASCVVRDVSSAKTVKGIPAM